MSMLRYETLIPVAIILASLAVAQNSAQTKTCESIKSNEGIKSGSPSVTVNSTPVDEKVAGATSGSHSVPVPIVSAAAGPPTRNPKLDKNETGDYVPDTRPRLEFEPRMNLNGGGFQNVSMSMSGGVGMEQRHLSWHFYGTYNAAKKTNDGTGSNPHGNIRSLGGELFYRTGSRWLLGGDYGYSQLRTTNYSKTGRGWDVGGGRDFAVSDQSMRLVVTYALPAGEYSQQGLTFHYMLPSPMNGGHVFFDERVWAGWLKTGRYGHYTHDASTTFGLLFRF